jgi:uncharacterized protein
VKEIIPSDVRAEILRRLRNTEKEHNVQILLAIESGSRAWGFASPNSDFDVRFIYVRTKDWYLSIDLENHRDVIEYPITDDIDLNGWDVRKALRLLLRSNPAFVEWIQSPIQYTASGEFASTVRDLLPSVYTPASGIYHYRSMAKTNYRGYLRAEQVPLKKYFYVLRPLLSVQWIERYNTAPPIEFQKLLHLIAENVALMEAISSLLQAKSTMPELGLSAPVPAINEFIEAELERLEHFGPPRTERAAVVPKLNALFQAVLSEVPRQ